MRRATRSRTTLNTEFADVLSEIDREATVAGLSTTGDVLGVRQQLDRHQRQDQRHASVWPARPRCRSRGHVITSQATAQSAVAAVASAVTLLGTSQATVGTLENRLQFAISLAQSQIVNNKAAESRIRDANVAEESANLTRFNILSQSGIAALSQANQQSASVLALLR